jgi:hypothetical protein
MDTSIKSAKENALLLIALMFEMRGLHGFCAGLLEWWVSHLRGIIKLIPIPHNATDRGQDTVIGNGHHECFIGNAFPLAGEVVF